MTATASVNPLPFAADYAALNNANADQPVWMQQLRARGWEQFCQLGLPRRKQEAWRLTDLRGFQPDNYQRLEPAPVDIAALPAPLNPDAIRLVFTQGQFSPSLSNLPELPQGVVIGALATALEQHADLLAPLVDLLIPEHPFQALNQALFSDGALIYVPQGKALEATIEIIHYNSGGQIHPRNIIVLEPGAEVSVVEYQLGNGDYFTTPVTHCYVAANARLRYHQLQQHSGKSFQLGSFLLEQAQSSTADLHFFSLQGKLNRTDIEVSLNGERAECSVDGLSLTDAKTLADYHVTVKHAVPQCQSRQLFKAVLDGQSKTVFDGLIKVVNDAQQTHAQQTNRNLLLSRRAIAHSNPRLEILADDVQCAHGSTTGFLDPDALFYLRARGISAAQAKAMLVYAFANEQIERITVDPLRERLEQVLYQRFHQEESA